MGFRRILIVAILTLGMASPAAAVEWLVFVIDRSSSIDAAELKLQRDAYVAVLRDEDVKLALHAAHVAIIEFDNTAQVVVPWSRAEQAAERYADWHPTGPRGGTGISRGLAAALKLLEGKRGRQVIDISGDGRENRDMILLEQSRAAATLAGIDVNGLVISGRTLYPLDEYYREQVANGFVIPVQHMTDFYQALRRKILREALVASLQPD